MNILFVCTGNICRSPMAEGILRNKFKMLHYTGTVDSAGFESFHIGDTADARAIAIMQSKGIDITDHKARLFAVEDFDRFDRIYVMDAFHYANVGKLSRTDQDMEKVDFIMNIIHPGMNQPVKDPWYDGMNAFEKVYAQLDQACTLLSERITAGTSLK
ncbi:MAG: low molecular weight phosphotyrosine protein phosphatase [Bacteroidetes bacterium]|nr:low molecular weight phosphotyrosine protein phosphatase [Bacteroidota bacterium]